ncbi:hypothetical protein HAX54_047174 [Datura stramonium]|uniref:Uncharacterized protein n=1 Tax=Datura stramonium TaxID=4076 RepID=A0ABS8SSM9_DATST|nr:hypothetical protein [Datura stramonium]
MYWGKANFKGAITKSRWSQKEIEGKQDNNNLVTTFAQVDNDLLEKVSGGEIHWGKEGPMCNDVRSQEELLNRCSWVGGGDKAKS